MKVYSFWVEGYFKISQPTWLFSFGAELLLHQISQQMEI